MAKKATKSPEENEIWQLTCKVNKILNGKDGEIVVAVLVGILANAIKCCATHPLFLAKYIYDIMVETINSDHHNNMTQAIINSPISTDNENS